MKGGGTTARCRVAQSPCKVQYSTVNEKWYSKVKYSTVNEKMVHQSEVQSIEPDTENKMIQLYTDLASKYSAVLHSKVKYSTVQYSTTF